MSAPWEDQMIGRCNRCGGPLLSSHICPNASVSGTAVDPLSIIGKRGASWERIAAEYKSERDALQGDVNRAREMQATAESELAALRAERDAIRELANVYNVGGWTDAIAPMQRALASEAKVEALRGLLSHATHLMENHMEAHDGFDAEIGACVEAAMDCLAAKEEG